MWGGSGLALSAYQDPERGRGTGAEPQKKFPSQRWKLPSSRRLKLFIWEIKTQIYRKSWTAFNDWHAWQCLGWEVADFLKNWSLWLRIAPSHPANGGWVPPGWLACRYFCISVVWNPSHGDDALRKKNKNKIHLKDNLCDGWLPEALVAGVRWPALLGRGALLVHSHWLFLPVESPGMPASFFASYTSTPPFFIPTLYRDAKNVGLYSHQNCSSGMQALSRPCERQAPPMMTNCLVRNWILVHYWLLGGYHFVLSKLKSVHFNKLSRPKNYCNNK